MKNKNLTNLEINNANSSNINKSNLSTDNIDINNVSPSNINASNVRPSNTNTLNVNTSDITNNGCNKNSCCIDTEDLKTKKSLKNLFNKKRKKEKLEYSDEHKKYLRKIKLKTAFVVSIQIAILVIIFGLWEILVRCNVIDGFIYSSPSRMISTLGTLMKSGELITHSLITLKETLLAFFIATGLGFAIAVLLWSNNTLKRILEPYIVVLNSLPKIALGPLIIIWFGAGTKAIVVMGILIVIIVTIINILNAFLNTDKNTILALESMGANKWQIFTKVVLPSSFPDIISTLKINVGLAWIGAIMGEYLVSKAGLGYLLVYGGLVFDLDLIMTVTVVLCVLASVMYFLIALLEKFVKAKR